MADNNEASIVATQHGVALKWYEKLVSQGLGWARKNSLFVYPYATACCGMARPMTSSPPSATGSTSSWCTGMRRICSSLPWTA